MLEYVLFLIREDQMEDDMQSSMIRTQSEIGKIFIAQGTLVIASLRAFRNRFAESISPGEVDLIFSAAERETAERFEGALKDAHEKGVLKGAQRRANNFKATVASGKVDMAFNLVNQRADKYATKVAAAKVTAINESTRKTLNEMITRGFREGVSHTAMERAIRNRFHEFQAGKPQKHIKSRAHLVTVTEYRDAYEEGHHQMAQEMMHEGFIVEKYWQTSEDDVVSDGCAENQDYGWIKEDDLFPSGNQHSPRFPGCRCNTLHRIREA